MPIAKLINRGRSQLLLLPKAFAFDAREVEIHRIGDEVILRPLRSTLAERLAALPPWPEDASPTRGPLDRVGRSLWP